MKIEAVATAAFVVICFAGACQEEKTKEPPKDEVVTPLGSAAYGTHHLVIVRDEKHRVICWLSPGREVALSCLPYAVVWHPEE